MNTQGYIKYIAIIIVILLVAFLSQQAYAWKFGKAVSSNLINQSSAALAKGSNWVTSKIYPKVTGEVQKRGDLIKKEVTQEKNKISENIGEKILNYFSGVENSIVHPGTPQNCPTTATASKK
ncbi:MAG: hypothetical protein NT094_00385 [Candidatus Staskawiczbacteria bacterium]|nr:hypothetical protein [Candidatus Staskawiczbacteria bacterium]